MKLSVVIPAYNEENYIGRCLQAVLREAAACGYPVEVVVVDNASTDATAEVAGRFPGVRLVREPRKGLSRARQKGYMESTGDIIANIDADTIMPRGYVRTLMRRFEKESRLACLTGPFEYYDLSPLARVFTTFFYLSSFLPNIIGQYVLKIGAAAQGGNFSVRRTALDKIGGFDTSIDFYGEDTDVATRLSRVGNVRFSFRLAIKTSARRLRGEGVFRTGYYSILNIIFVLFYGKPLTKTHRDIRTG